MGVPGPPMRRRQGRGDVTSDHLARAIAESARRFADHPAMRMQQDGAWRSLTYRELGGVVRAAAAALVAAGVGPGDRVARPGLDHPTGQPFRTGGR